MSISPVSPHIGCVPPCTNAVYVSLLPTHFRADPVCRSAAATSRAYLDPFCHCISYKLAVKHYRVAKNSADARSREQRLFCWSAVSVGASAGRFRARTIRGEASMADVPLIADHSRRTLDARRCDGSPDVSSLIKGSNFSRLRPSAKTSSRLGRLSSSHLHIDDPSISRMHAMVEVTGPTRGVDR
jgi:hypothetical protein